MIEDIRNPFLRRAAIIAVLLASPILIPILARREIAEYVRDTIATTAHDVREIW